MVRIYRYMHSSEILSSNVDNIFSIVYILRFTWVSYLLLTFHFEHIIKYNFFSLLLSFSLFLFSWYNEYINILSVIDAMTDICMWRISLIITGPYFNFFTFIKFLKHSEMKFIFQLLDNNKSVNILFYLYKVSN